MIDLSGHAALVTGSSMGIGRAIVEACAAAGADVVVHGLPGEGEVEEVLEACRSHGVSASLIELDLTGPTDEVVATMFDRAIEACPNLDILINNAGRLFDVLYEEMTLDRFEKTMRLNVTTGYFLTQRFSRHWIDRNVAGRVLFTSSINGQLAELDSTAYDTSKGAVEMMIRTLSVALIRKNIRVNGLGPGLIRTHGAEKVLERPEEMHWLAHHTPNGMIPPPSVCGEAAVFLVSDAAEHIVGHTLMVDGGMSAWQHPWRETWHRG